MLNLFFLKSVFAQEPISNPAITGLSGGEGTAGAKFGTLISSLLAAFIIVGALFTLFNLLQGGLGWITSGGDKTALEGARNRIQNAILGLLITAATWALFILLTKFLGITPLNSSTFQINLPSLFGQ